MVWAAIPALAGLGLGIYQAARANKQQKKQEALAEQELKGRPSYAPTQASTALLNDAQSRVNAVNPAILAAQQQAQQQAATNTANAQRFSTSGAEALQAGAVAQAQYQNMLPGLLQAQTQYAQQNRGQYYGALQGMGEEQRLVAQDRNAAYSDRFNWQLGRANASNYNRQQGINLAANALSTGASLYGASQQPQYQQQPQAYNASITPAMYQNAQAPYYGSPDMYNSGVYWPQ